MNKFIGGLIGLAALAASALPGFAQQAVVKFGYLADPSHEAVMWALKNGKVTSDKVKVEATALDIAALIQATPARTYDVVQTAAVAVPRARERGLDLRIVGTGLRYHPVGGGADIWVKKDSPIKGPSDLKGKKLGVYSIGSAGITLIRIAMADVYGLNMAAKGGDVELVELPAPALPAALATGRIDAATLIHAQAFEAGKTGDFVSIAKTGQDMTNKFGMRMVSAVLAGYGEKLDANPALYKDFLALLRASMTYALKNPKEVFTAVGEQTKTDPAFFEAWFNGFSEFPVDLTQKDIAAIELLWKRSVDLGLLGKLPPMSEAVWRPAVTD